MLASVQDNLIFIVFVQALGLVGMLLDLSAANSKSDSRLIRLIFVSSLIFAAHFALLMALPAAVSELITAARYWLADKYKRLWVGLSFVGLYVAMAFLIADNIVDYMPFFASVVGTLAVFLLSGIPMRVVFIIGQLTWVIYSAIVLSLGGFILYVALIGITGATIFRLYKKKTQLS